ncbi:hypothetical protein QEN41_14600 [Gordonia alkanivorans]|nr:MULTISPECIES: hypothetical protein [Gordonia]MDH3012120.1 hypothetical protein [Gordonia alkanivorans]MDH3021225.1 hypothetical protein [Gordonia alkanivorans]MDH3046474.1 hypothetical protein [Gordonia alkanivorans]MDJ0008680.1 hypothetical protein [Gordonia alkanivorans]MDJ0028072.1 hypothetical protein [Gordonia alkanivorans]
MSRPGPRAAIWFRGLIVPLALAVMLMHTVIAGPATASSHPDAHFDPAGHHSPSTGSAMTPAAVMGEHPAMSGEDCGDHDHACVFTRAAGIDIPPVVLVLLIWAFLSLSVAGLYRPARRGIVVLGRPPPWAIRTHLQLQVVRC